MNITGCSIVGCQPPLLLGNLDVGGDEGLPPLAFVGIGLCCVVGMILVAAIVMYHVSIKHYTSHTSMSYFCSP